MSGEAGNLSSLSSTPQNWALLDLIKLSVGKRNGEINSR